MTGDIWIINGRCETCVGRELDDMYCGDIGCDCWCHDDRSDGEWRDADERDMP